jgi:replicative DNA helicase
MTAADDFERVPPHDVTAEQCVLGAMLLSQDAISDVTEVLQPADHYRPAHQIVHGAILELHGHGKPVDAITVADHLAETGLIGRVGGAPYIHTLLAAVPTAANAGWYARIVRKHAVMRRLIEAGTRITQSGYAADVDADEIPGRVAEAYRFLDEAAGKAVRARASSLADLIGPALDRIEAGIGTARGVKTGWRDLDDLLLGFHPGQMVTIGARPRVGKSVLLLNVAAYAALHLGLHVLACSLEMSADECIERILAAEGSVSLHGIRSADLADADWARIAKVHHRITEHPGLLINADPYLTVQGIRSELRAMRQAGTPASLVVVDYLQLMASGGKPESRQAEVSEISRGLKLLAKEFDVPVLVGSQLNRGPEMRSDHLPQLADLRESGSVEQDSDVVILLHREDVYEAESPRAGEIDLLVRKNRQGPQATITMAFQGHFARCMDMYRPWKPSAALEEAA